VGQEIGGGDIGDLHIFVTSWDTDLERGSCRRVRIGQWTQPGFCAKEAWGARQEAH
jgi:hypothetical protein